MEKVNRIVFLLFTVALMSSFTIRPESEIPGAYGVSSSDPSDIKLILNPDHSFYYQDFSLSGKQIVVKGSWVQARNNKIVLKSSENKIKFHNIWTFACNGQIVKSRRGLTFYRLKKIST